MIIFCNFVPFASPEFKLEDKKEKKRKKTKGHKKH